MQQRGASGLRTPKILSKMRNIRKALCALLALLGLHWLGQGRYHTAVGGGWRRMQIARCAHIHPLPRCGTDLLQQAPQRLLQHTSQWRLVWSDEFDYNGLPDP